MFSEGTTAESPCISTEGSVIPEITSRCIVDGDEELNDSEQVDDPF